MQRAWSRRTRCSDLDGGLGMVVKHLLVLLLVLNMVSVG